MARIRTIKPDFFLHTGLAELTPLHRLLFIGLWTQADKKGRLEDNPRKIRVTVLPYDDCNIDSMLDDLQSHHEKFITRYEITDSGKYIQINNFEAHQRPHHTEQDSVIPPLPNGSRTVKQRLSNRSETDIKGKERKGKERIKVHDYSEEFLTFWNDYKKKEDKPYAWSCYQKRLADGINPESIRKHLAAYNAKIEANSTEMRFIKNPSTFLNRTDFKELPVHHPVSITSPVDDAALRKIRAWKEEFAGGVTE